MTAELIQFPRAKRKPSSYNRALSDQAHQRDMARANPKADRAFWKGEPERDRNSDGGKTEADTAPCEYVAPDGDCA